MPAGKLTPPDQLQKTVTFKDGDKQVASVKVETGKAIATDGLIDQSMPANPTKDGFKFKEWNTQKDGQGTPFTGTTPVDKDLTVYAIYTKNPVTPPQPKPPVQDQKTITFNKKDGTLLTTVKVETGKQIAAMPAAPAEEGFTFKEWNTQKDGSGTVFNVDTVVNEDLTVYAIYTKNPVTPPQPQPQPQPPQPPTPAPQPQPQSSTPTPTVLEETSPTPTTTNEPSESTTSEKSGRAEGHIVAKTGETPTFANMLAGIGLAIAGLITGLHKKKREDK